MIVVIPIFAQVERQVCAWEAIKFVAQTTKCWFRRFYDSASWTIFRGFGAIQTPYLYYENTVACFKSSTSSTRASPLMHYYVYRRLEQCLRCFWLRFMTSSISELSVWDDHQSYKSSSDVDPYIFFRKACAPKIVYWIFVICLINACHHFLIYFRVIWWSYWFLRIMLYFYCSSVRISLAFQIEWSYLVDTLSVFGLVLSSLSSTPHKLTNFISIEPLVLFSNL